MKHILRYNGMTRARIHTRIHTYPDIFESATISFRIQKFSRPLVSVFKSNLPVHSYPTHIRILSSTQDSFGNIGIRACVLEREICILLCLERTWERGCHCEYSIHGKELGLILLRHRIKKIGTLRSDDGDGNENVLKAIDLISKRQLCTCITLFCTFLRRFYKTTT